MTRPLRGDLSFFCLALLATFSSVHPASTQTFSQLHAFGFPVEPQVPTGTLLRGSDGNFYGTSGQGGVHGFGTVFKITPDDRLSTLVSFLSSLDAPSGLAQRHDGNFYGTTRGADSDAGTVFRVTPTGSLTTLFTFNLFNSSGAYPSPVVKGSGGNLYGTTLRGGARDMGIVFVLHYHAERNHQGLDNKIIQPEFPMFPGEGAVRCRKRLGGLLRYYLAA